MKRKSLGLGELAEVLTVTAKKLAGLKLGRKFSGAPRKDVASPEKRKPTVRFAGRRATTGKEIPGARRRVRRLRPRPRLPGQLPGSAKGKSQDQANKGRRHQAFYVRDYGSVEIGDGHNFSIFQANVVFNAMDALALTPTSSAS